MTGGNGGAGGAAAGAGIAGTPGAGGVGIIGSGLTIFNSGNISGGVSGDSATRANAITFTGGSNVLELQPGSTIFGNVVDQTSAGTLRLGGAINTTGSFDASSIGPAAQYQGFSTFIKTGDSTWSSDWFNRGSDALDHQPGNLGHSERRQPWCDRRRYSH